MEKNNSRVSPNAQAAIVLAVQKNLDVMGPTMKGSASSRPVDRLAWLLILFFHEVIEQQGPDSCHKIEKEERRIPDLGGEGGRRQKRDQANRI